MLAGWTRQQLAGAVKLLVLVGMLLLLIPFIKSLGWFGSRSLDRPGLRVDVLELRAGAYLAVHDNAGREIWVYRWNEADKQQQRQFDPKKAWSVLIPYVPARGCRVRLIEQADAGGRFIDPCEGTVFDVLGAPMTPRGDASAQGLHRLDYRWLGESQMELTPLQDFGG